MKHLIVIFVCTLATLLVCVHGTFADPPTEIAFQGRLLNPDTGGVVSDGNYSIVFSLYTTETSGTAAWQETQTVAVKDGVYSVKLGSQTAFGTLSFNQVLYLGIKIEDDSEMTPRLKLTASPHAFNANKLADKESSYYLDWDNITDMPAGFADGVDNEGSGEANTASNKGTAGVGVYKQKTGTDLELRSVNAGSNKVTVTLDDANNEIDIDADASEIVTSTTVGAATAVMDSDFSGTEGFMRKTGDETYEVIKCNLAAAAAPTADEDTDDGYAIGSTWIDTTADKAYVCVDASSGAAVWIETSVTGGSGGETNTASNVGTAGVGVYKQKTGTDLELRSVNTGSNKVTVTLDDANNEIDIDADASEIVTSTTVGAATAVMDSDFSGTEGFMRKTGDETYEVIKCNLAAAAAPTADEDTDDGYAIGSTWIDTTADKAYVCVDASSGAAVWIETSVTGGSGGETNTASNVGTAGVGVYKQKTGDDLELRNINAGSNKVTVTLDAANSEIDIDVNEANLSVDADTSTISNLELDNLKAGVLDTDLSSVSGSDDTLGSAKAIKTYVDAQIPITDTSAFLKDNADNTKLLRFELGGLTSGATRVATPPDSDFTMARTDDAQSFTGTQSFLGTVNLQDALNIQETGGGTDNAIISVAALGADRTYTIPEAGTNASFVMSAGNQTINGAKTFGNAVSLQDAFNIQDTGNDHNAGISVADLAAGRSYTIPEAGADASFVMSAGAQNINGAKTFNIISCSVADRSERFGSGAGLNLTGSGVSLFGGNAGKSLTSGSWSCAFGYNALRDCTTSSVNAVFGQNAAMTLSGGYNTVVGCGAMDGAGNANYNVAIGSNCLRNVTGERNIAIGDYCCINMTSGDRNTAIGQAAGSSLGAGDSKTVLIGYDAEGNADYAVAIGAESYSRGNSVAVGSLAKTGSGVDNTSIGHQAGTSLSGSYACTFLGYRAGASAPNSAEKNTCIGSQAGENVTDYGNTLVGYLAGQLLTNRTENTFVGGYAGAGANASGPNTFIGWGSGYQCSGEYNTVVGEEAGEEMTDSDSNVLIGKHAGRKLGGGDQNVIIGSLACDSGSPTGTVAIGDEANVTASNSIGLGRAVTIGSANTFAAGSDTAAMNTVYFGRGISSATPSAYTISGTKSSANGTDGGGIKISGGIANQASDDGGAIELQTAGGGDGTARTTRVKVTPAGLTSLYNGDPVASAASIVPSGNLFHVTGTTDITSITSTDVTAGTRITIIFDDALTFTDGNNLKLAGNFTTSADDTITLVYDGTSWFEVSRSAN